MLNQISNIIAVASGLIGIVVCLTNSDERWIGVLAILCAVAIVVLNKYTPKRKKECYSSNSTTQIINKGKIMSIVVTNITIIIVVPLLIIQCHNPHDNPMPPLNSVISNIKIGIVHDTDGDIAINKEPNAKYRIGTIPEGESCTVYLDKSDGNWYWVEYNGISGYSYSDYISLQE